MNEQQTMLADMAGGLFAELGHSARVEIDWQRVEELGFANLLVPEDAGGFGGTWSDAAIVFRLVGYHALALPLPEAAIAAALAGRAGCVVDGFGTIAARCDGTLDGDRFTGVASGIPWGGAAGYVVAPSPDGGGMIVATDACEVKPGRNVAGEARDTLRFEDAPVVRIEADPLELGAAARAMQLAGAMDAALALSVGYVNERVQFGRPLAKFQAVQQALAQFAVEAAAANCAAVALGQALDFGDARFEIAAAKTRASMAASLAAATAHQVHGAIGFTQEYALHPLTRRLLSWRAEFGSEAYWSLELGRRVAQTGADAFWPEMVARSDRVQAQSA